MWKKNRHTMPDNGRCLMVACYAGQWTLLDGGMLCRTMDVAKRRQRMAENV